MRKLEMEFKEKTGLNFVDFYKTQKPKLTWFLAKWTKDLTNAEDFAEDAFIKALESIGGYNGTKSQAHTWLFSIAINIVKKDYQDKQKVQMVSIDKELMNSSTMDMFMPYHDEQAELVKQNELSKKIDIIREAIFSMSEKQEKYQTVLIMRELENMTYEDISKELIVNINTVKSRIKKGREILVNKVSKHLDMVDICGVY
jgi:RNA polymerase sigma-70 factor (ECF subfamily)